MHCSQDSSSSGIADSSGRVFHCCEGFFAVEAWRSFFCCGSLAVVLLGGQVRFIVFCGVQAWRVLHSFCSGRALFIATGARAPSLTCWSALAGCVVLPSKGALCFLLRRHGLISVGLTKSRNNKKRNTGSGFQHICTKFHIKSHLPKHSTMRCRCRVHLQSGLITF